MLNKTTFRLSVLATSALLLGACAGQQSAPVATGTDGYYANGINNNPYGINSNVVNPYTDPYNANNTVNATYPIDSNSVVNNGYGGTSATNPYSPPSYVPTYTPPYTNSVGNVNGVYIGNYSSVNKNASTHRVEAGDTVYNIAKRYGISQDNLRAWNGLSDNTISLGQVLYVKKTGGTPSPKPVNAGSTTPPAVNQTATSFPSTPANTPLNVGRITSTQGGINWQAPANGVVSKAFSTTTRGIEIKGTRDTGVFAAADGEVVYSGTQLRGYGNLVIVQHAKPYLTAYGNNAKLLVKEGERVKRGQQIATLGERLTFELRKDGTPIDPRKLIGM